MTRVVPFEGCFNFRDLGGWQTDDGRRVRWRRLYRADSVHLMSPADAVRAKDELGLRLLLDLRSDLEIGATGTGLLAEDGLARRHLPFSDRLRANAVIDGTVADATISDRSPARMTERYLAMLEGSAGLIVEAVESLAADDGLPAVFFCSAGKDRTGVLSAVVLGAIGVRDEDVVADYELTSQSIVRIIERFAAAPGAPAMYRELPRAHFTPYAETMENVVRDVRSRYGSFAGYLTAKRLAEDALALLRSRLLDRPGE